MARYKQKLFISALFLVLIWHQSCSCNSDRASEVESSNGAIAPSASQLEQISIQGCDNEDFTVVPASGLQSLTLAVSNASSFDMTNLRILSDIGLGFSGGEYPGTNGTCTDQLSAGGSCDIVVSHNSPTARRMVDAEFIVGFDINGETYQTTCRFNYDALGLIGQNTLDLSRNALTGSYRIGDVHYDGTHFVMSEAGAHRVLIWNTLPTSSSQEPDVILGNASRNTPAFSAPAASASSLRYPTGIFSDGTRLFVADTYNHRVLVWTSFPTEDGQAADLVIGQDDFTSVTANKGGAVDRSTLNLPWDVSFRSDTPGSALVIADSQNNRVLVYDGLPVTNGASADLILGQTTDSGTGTACSASGMSFPRGIAFNDSRLAISDNLHNRVLVYDIANWSTWLGSADGIASSYQVGDAACASGTTNAHLAGPMGLGFSGGNLFIADHFNARVIEAVPDTGAFVRVLGQPDFNSSYAHWDGSGASEGIPSARSFSRPHAVSTTANQLWVGDAVANRVSEFNLSGLTNGSAAQRILRQPNERSTTAYSRSTGEIQFSKVEGVHVTDSRVFISDLFNHRILVWNELPNGDVQPDFVLGQENVYEGVSGHGSGAVFSKLAVNAGSFYNPSHLNTHTLSDGSEKFTVSDYFNHRLLIWRSIPTENTPADVVIGQNNMTERVSVCDPTTIVTPGYSITVNDRLYVADYGHHRVFVYNTWPDTDDAVPSFHLGQNDGSGCSANRGGVVANNTLNGPWGLASDGTNLVVGDWLNNRILIWNTAPTADGPADIVLGQADFSSAVMPSEASANVFWRPWGLAVASGKLYVADTGYHRILTWNLPAASGSNASEVIGQPNFSAATSGYGMVGQLANPMDLSFHGGALYVSDRLMRVVSYPIDPP